MAQKAPLRPRPASRAVQIHRQPFVDHAGKAAVSVFWAPSDQPLPPLYSFAIFVTARDGTPDSFDAPDLLRALTRSRYAPHTMAYRLDVYFLPGATVAACTAYYDAERRERGLYTRQLEALASSAEADHDDGADDSTSPSGSGSGSAPSAQVREGKLPGLVPSYLRTPSFCHHHVLFICDGSWRSEDGMLFVEFHPASSDEFEPDPEDPADLVQPVKVQRLPVRPDTAMYEGGPTAQGRMFEMVLIEEQELSDPYEEALERAWRSW